jgi:hypothetical protein
MSDGDGGCDGGGAHIEGGTAGGLEGAAYGAEKQPIPIDERLKINGAPITDQSHEFVLKKNDAQD